MELGTVRKPKAKSCLAIEKLPLHFQVLLLHLGSAHVFLPLLFQKKSSKAVMYCCSSHFLSDSLIPYMCHKTSVRLPRDVVLELQIKDAGPS